MGTSDSISEMLEVTSEPLEALFLQGYRRADPDIGYLDLGFCKSIVLLGVGSDSQAGWGWGLDLDWCEAGEGTLEL